MTKLEEKFKPGLNIILYPLLHASKSNYLDFDERSASYFKTFGEEKLHKIAAAIEYALNNPSAEFSSLLPGLEARFSNEEIMSYLENILNNFKQYDLV